MERLNCWWVRTWTHTDVREVADGDRSDRGLLFPHIFCTAELFLTTSLIKRWFPWFGVDERKWNRPVARIKCCQSTSQQTTDTSIFVHVIGLHDMIMTWLSYQGGGGDGGGTEERRLTPKVLQVRNVDMKYRDVYYAALDDQEIQECERTSVTRRTQNKPQKSVDRATTWWRTYKRQRC